MLHLAVFLEYVNTIQGDLSCIYIIQGTFQHYPGRLELILQISSNSMNSTAICTKIGNSIGIDIAHEEYIRWPCVGYKFISPVIYSLLYFKE